MQHDIPTCGTNMLNRGTFNLVEPKWSQNLRPALSLLQDIGGDTGRNTRS